MSAQDFKDKSSMLRIGTTLRGIYRIDRYLASGGFGKTYVGYNTEFGEQIAIKEFFLRGVALRDDNQTSVSISSADSEDIFNEQKEKFKKEARRLRKLRNEHLVSVHDLFEENGTAYYVMDYVDGENLRERLERTGQPIKEQEVWDILSQILDALKYVHNAGIWHLDLKPGNIMVDRNGVAKLIDFGASKQFDKQKGGATAHTSVTFTNGYAPREQMEKNYEKFGPWTDIYALGATLYALLTNDRPPMPSDIDDDDSVDKHEALLLPSGTSLKMRNLIIWMMNTNRNRRPQSIDEILTFLSNEENVINHENDKYESNDGETNSVRQETADEETEFVTRGDIDQDETIINQGFTVSEEGHRSDKSQFYDNRNDNDNGYLEEYADENDDRWKDWLKVGAVIIGVIAIIALFMAPRAQCSSSNNDLFPADSVDTCAVDTVVTDTIVSNIINVTNKPYVISGMGKCSYTGEWNEEYEWPEGNGEAKFTDGRYYKGEFLVGDMHGNAYFRYANGDTFEGEFKDSKFYYGTYTVKEDGSYYKGYFKNGSPSKGKWYNKNGTVIDEV